MKPLILISILLFSISLANLSWAQGINQISIYPSNPTGNDTVYLISDFSYYGNCTYGLVSAAVLQNDSVIQIYPEYCGFGDSTLCHAIDTFSMGILAEGNYNIELEYHQGTVCAGGFDAIIANFDTSLYIGALSVNTTDAFEDKICIYPNPTQDYLNIEMDHTESTQIKLLTMAGKLVLQTEFESQIKLNTTSLAKASYLLVIEHEGRTVSHKIVIE